MDRKLVLELIKKHEGFRDRLYCDKCGKDYPCNCKIPGKLTIGWGWNIEDRGISIFCANCKLNEDISRTEQELADNFDWYPNLSINRRAALIDMCFNIGLPKFKQFKKMIKAIENQDFKEASVQMLDSRWATQVKGRAKELAQMMRKD